MRRPAPGQPASQPQRALRLRLVLRAVPAWPLRRASLALPSAPLVEPAHTRRPERRRSSGASLHVARYSPTHDVFARLLPSRVLAHPITHCRSHVGEPLLQRRDGQPPERDRPVAVAYSRQNRPAAGHSSRARAEPDPPSSTSSCRSWPYPHRPATAPVVLTLHGGAGVCQSLSRIARHEGAASHVEG